MDIPEKLRDAIIKDKLVIFVGSGFSRQLELPDWKQLAFKAIQEYKVIKEDHEEGNHEHDPSKVSLLEACLKENVLNETMVFDALRRLNKSKIFNALKKHTNINIDNTKLDNHKRLWKISSKIITTNYDKGLEMVKPKLTIEAVSHDHKIEVQDFVEQDAWLFHIHGKIDNISSCVIFSDDYYALYHQENAAIELLKYIAIGHTILFIGFSMNDQYVAKLFDNIHVLFDHKLSGKHFMLQRTAKTSSNQPVQIIPIQNHDEIPDFLDSLIKIKLKLGQPISAENDEFAKYTIVQRFPEIVHKIGLSYNMKEHIRLFSDEDTIIPYELRKAINESITRWSLKSQRTLAELTRQEFFDKVDFIVAEHYLYYDILRKIGKIEDPYKRIKFDALTDKESDKEEERISKKIKLFLERSFGHFRSSPSIGLPELMKYSLIGNTTDLSQLVINQKLEETPRLIINDSSEVFGYLTTNKKYGKIDVIVDNSGFELIQDLTLAIGLLKWKLTKKVVVHLNILPIFVSDAIHGNFGSDIIMIKDFLAELFPPFLDELNKYESTKVIEWAPNHFWSSHLEFRKMSDDIRNKLTHSDLLIIKGDLNYRRLVGDRRMEIDSQIIPICSYLPTSALAIRTLKSNVLIGVSPAKKQEIVEHPEFYDETWKTSGQFGIIQLIRKVENPE